MRLLTLPHLLVAAGAALIMVAIVPPPPVLTAAEARALTYENRWRAYMNRRVSRPVLDELLTDRHFNLWCRRRVREERAKREAAKG